MNNDLWKDVSPTELRLLGNQFRRWKYYNPEVTKLLNLALRNRNFALLKDIPYKAVVRLQGLSEIELIDVYGTAAIQVLATLGMLGMYDLIEMLTKSRCKDPELDETVMRERPGVLNKFKPTPDIWRQLVRTSSFQRLLVNNKIVKLRDLIEPDIADDEPEDDFMTEGKTVLGTALETLTKGKTRKYVKYSELKSHLGYDDEEFESFINNVQKANRHTNRYVFTHVEDEPAIGIAAAKRKKRKIEPVLGPEPIKEMRERELWGIYNRYGWRGLDRANLLPEGWQNMTPQMVINTILESEFGK